MKSRIRQDSISGIGPSVFIRGGVSSVLFIGVSSLILIISLFKPEALSSLRMNAIDVISPALSLFVTPFQNMADTVGGVSSVASLRAENAQLKTENQRLKEWYQTALMLQAENQSLQELLNLKVNPAHKYVTARVISDSSNAFIKTVLISSGVEDGIKKHQAVLAGEGMIGRIIEAGDKSSRVLLMNDINSRIPIVIEGSRQKAILAGRNLDLLDLKHLPEDSSFVEGQRVITSGDGGVFPPGLPIGRVVKEDGGIFRVRPYANMGKVSYVRVMNSLPEENVMNDSTNKVSQ